MSQVFAVHGNSDEHLAALLDIAELDRQVEYLEGQLERARSHAWIVAILSAAGWILLVITNWRLVCLLGEALVASVGRMVAIVGHALGGLL